ncbi:unnamed protein product [Didymodactylos carnosus]|uniref:NAD-dependent epimerase/dehydratase domain-containing protein n=1 Tax=Didymodactylos carnosus TaxID=1234261 RepID=A0A814WKZ2_9BILA|nr:unnamed protein product [Didymodactylos carnosus]CAF1240072.1 unnamed protein product [Didymodactylos carnosus]CAF3964401.1 unnamed protein product [Didymodactylos carnosus]CAF4047528.1 unnamed protein product [Didymodactylos carnosus]
MSTSVFIVGVNGYIGFGVAKAYRRSGYKVYGLIRNEKFERELVKEEIIPIVANIDDINSYKEELLKCSIIIDAIGWNKDSSDKFLQFVLDAGQERVKNGQQYKPLYIFTTGIMTYGVVGDRPIDETIKPQPGTTIMKNKENFENKVLSNDKYIYPVVVRPGWVYGGTGGAVADWIYNEKDEIILWGRKDKRWSWVHVDDLGDGYVLIGRTNPNIVRNQVFNLAAPNDNPTFEEVRLKMAKVNGWTSDKIKYHEINDETEEDLRSWDSDSIINPAKAMDQLGWRPRHIGYLHEILLYYKSWEAHKQQSK